MDRRVSLFSPAKVNLFLAITDRREDGFHNLVSLVAPVTFGDDLVVEGTEAPGFVLTCDDAEVPLDDSNLILRAARAYASASPTWSGGARFQLTKRIPMGAGLGGGSSNAVAALRALDQLAPTPLGETELARLAASLGSDCVLFLKQRPLIMRGRGEHVADLRPEAARALVDRRLLLFKPAFGIATAWAYGQMAAKSPEWYLPASEAEARLAAWLEAPASIEPLLFNNMEAPAFAKYVALPVMLAWIRERWGLPVRMSGSGSACFAVLPEAFDAAPVIALIREAWGRHAFVTEAKIP